MISLIRGRGEREEDLKRKPEKVQCIVSFQGLLADKEYMFAFRVINVTKFYVSTYVLKNANYTQVIKQRVDASIS